MVMVRHATAEDEAFVNNLTVTTMAGYVEATWPDDPIAHSCYWELNKFDSSNTRILQVDGNYVGRLSTTLRADCVFIDEIHVVPEYQRKGIGQEAIEVVLEEARRLGLSVRLTVLEVNPAQGLYLRMGFTITGTRDHRIHMEYTCR
jgi:GNAT superfamily N-acetyltransferase